MEAPKSLRARPLFPKTRVWYRSFAFVAVFLALAFASMVGFYKMALASLPGSPLYPVKRQVERVVEEITGDRQPAIDSRAHEIIDLSKQNEVDNKFLEQTVQEYKQNVTEVKSEAQKSGGDDSELQQKLNEQHTQFDNVVKENPDVQETIQDAIKVSEDSQNEDSQNLDQNQDQNQNQKD